MEKHRWMGPHEAHPEPLMSTVQTLAPYLAGPKVANRLLGAWAGRWFDLAVDWSDAQERPTRLAHPEGSDVLFRNDRWSTATISNSIGNVFAVMANGADPPVRFNGHLLESARCELDPEYVAEFGATAAPPFDSRRLKGVTAFKNRLWWHETTGPNLWYGHLYAPGGTLRPWPVGAVAGETGDVAALAKISRDGGDGPDDYLVILFRSGTAVVYAGIDPEVTTGDHAFRVIGRFFVGEPIGDRPFVEWGSQLLALTKRGVLPISAVLEAKPVTAEDYFTEGIHGLWTELVDAYGEQQGWEAFVHPDGRKLFVNVPNTENTDRRGVGWQLAMNLQSLAWCVFRGWNAGTWAAFEGRPFFAHSTRPEVIEADVLGLATDVGEPIRVAWQTAFTYMPNPAAFGRSRGGEGVQKYIKAIALEMLTGNLPVDLEVGVVADFEQFETARVTRASFPANAHSVRRRYKAPHKGYSISAVVRSPEIPADLSRVNHGPFTLYNLTMAYGLGKKV